MQDKVNLSPSIGTLRLRVDVPFIRDIGYNASIVYGLTAHFLFVAEIWTYTACWNLR